MSGDKIFTKTNKLRGPNKNWGVQKVKKNKNK